MVTMKRLQHFLELPEFSPPASLTDGETCQGKYDKQN